MGKRYLTNVHRTGVKPGMTASRAEASERRGTLFNHLTTVFVFGGEFCQLNYGYIINYFYFSDMIRMMHNKLKFINKKCFSVPLLIWIAIQHLLRYFKNRCSYIHRTYSIPSKICVKNPLTTAVSFHMCYFVVICVWKLYQMHGFWFSLIKAERVNTTHRGQGNWGGWAGGKSMRLAPAEHIDHWSNSNYWSTCLQWKCS